VCTSALAGVNRPFHACLDVLMYTCLQKYTGMQFICRST